MAIAICDVNVPMMIPLRLSNHDTTAEVALSHHQTVHVGLGG